MKDEIKELLAVLDMPEDSPEQYGWMLSTIREHNTCCIADLAFRLRDEAVKTCRYKYDDAIIQVYSVSKESAETFHWWWIRHSQPIHVIIAALIAKHLS